MQFIKFIIKVNQLPNFSSKKWILILLKNFIKFKKTRKHLICINYNNIIQFFNVIFCSQVSLTYRDVSDYIGSRLGTFFNVQ